MAEELSTAIPQSQASSTKKRASKNEKLCLEDYLHLVHSRQTLHLTMNQLHQVIRIHGFKKIHHAPKKVLVQAVESLDLVDLPRSTVSESVSAFAAVALEDVVADLGELSWQECCVTSVEKISFSDGQSVFPAACSDQSLRVVNHSLSQAQKENRIDETRNPIPEASSKDLKPTKMVLKRKRSNLRDSVASTLDSASLASC
ncbi:hypothetical protein GLYMA_06G277900v4 [Glycine max]|uniref:DUF7787 domain-containing protein n=1 Tax=Glycine max TaxID=3847 RepID=A0A0R0JUL8_SOYBN|nr:hypothetical protein GLYMA_06G277900v4 [Glycine max]|eukprot:XP_006582280.2 uncharacterized protein LOC102668028 [Glycine max]